MPEVRHCRAPRIRTVARIESGAALDDLRFIRQTLENSTSFTAVPGWGMVGMSGVAALAAAVAWRQSGFDGWCVTWLIAAIVALSLAMLTMYRKAARAGIPLFTGAGRKFLLNFLPPLAVGALLTLALYRADAVQAIPGVWLLLYGTAVVSGGAFSVRIVPAMGFCFMGMGALALLAPVAWTNLFMVAGFCGLHLVFGFLIARKYGG
ncbi:MAG: hypothetical protein ACRD3E_08300 [Terriglobales bacterium]